jgi:hypothetical protein
MRPEPDMAPPSGQPAADMPMSAEFVAARQQLQERLANWQPPEGASPEEAAALRDRLEGLLQRFRPDPGQSTTDAIAELRDEFEVRIDNFTQDAKLDALTDAQNQAGGGAMPPPSPEFEAQRQQLLQRLEDWTPPEGTDPTEAAALRAELQGLINRAQPLPGQSVEDAVADLRQRFDGQVHDFETDQKLEVIIDEEQREEAEAGAGGATTDTPPSDGSTTDAPGETPSGETPDGETPTDGSTGSTGTPPPTTEAAFEARRQELINELENWRPSAGMDAVAAEARRTELLQQVRQAQPVAGQSIDASFPPVRSDPLLFNTGVVAPSPEPTPEPPADETPPADDAPAGETPGQDDEAPPAEDAPAAETPDPRVTTPLPETGLHTADDFDAMAGIGGDATEGITSDAMGDMTGDLVADGPQLVPGAAQDAPFVPMTDVDVLGESQVADAMIDQPEMVDAAVAPTYDQATPLDDLGLDTPVLVDDFTPSEPEPEPITFDEPDLEPAMSDFAEPEPEPEPVAAADDGSDDLGLT